MKKILALMLTVVLVIGMAGCGNSEKQDALISYINDDLAAIAEIEAKFMASYQSVSGNNFTSDEAMYNEFTTNTVVLARQLSDKTVEIAATIEDAEILEAHKLYMESAANYLNGVTMMISALENQDYAQVTDANEKITRANALGLDYKNKLTALADENGVVLE